MGKRGQREHARDNGRNPFATGVSHFQKILIARVPKMLPKV